MSELEKIVLSKIDECDRCGKIKHVYLFDETDYLCRTCLRHVRSIIFVHKYLIA